MTSQAIEPHTDRQERSAVLATAPAADLLRHWQALGLDPDFRFVRGPEIGLVSLRGRIGGGGAPFPFGDATATRATVRLDDGRVGHAMTLGRDSQRATIAAVIDALCQDAGERNRVHEQLIAPLQEAIRKRDDTRAAETAATRVDFFTMVRGED